MHIRPMHDRVVVPSKLDHRRTPSLPHEVIEDPSLSLVEKRAILAEWASDRSAVESYPTLRWLAGTTFPVTFSSIMDARQKLDALEARIGKEGEEERGQEVVAGLVQFKSLKRRTGSLAVGSAGESER